MAKITKGSSAAALYETNAAVSHPLMSWRASIAGTIIAGFIACMLMALGVALGGITLKNTANPSADTAALIGGVWFLVSCLIALFCGSYFSARVSKLHTSRLAGSQGVFVAALFFAMMTFEVVTLLGVIGSAAGTAVNAAATASSNPQVTNNIDVNKSDIQNQVDKLKAQVTGNQQQIQNNAGDVLQAIGWSAFITMFLGTLAAFGGGSLAAYRNVRRPLTIDDMVTDTTAGLAGATV